MNIGDLNTFPTLGGTIEPKVQKQQENQHQEKKKNKKEKKTKKKIEHEEEEEGENEQQNNKMKEVKEQDEKKSDVTTNQFFDNHQQLIQSCDLDATSSENQQQQQQQPIFVSVNGPATRILVSLQGTSGSGSNPPRLILFSKKSESFHHHYYNNNENKKEKKKLWQEQEISLKSLCSGTPSCASWNPLTRQQHENEVVVGDTDGCLCLLNFSEQQQQGQQQEQQQKQQKQKQQQGGQREEGKLLCRFNVGGRNTVYSLAHSAAIETVTPKLAVLTGDPTSGYQYYRLKAPTLTIFASKSMFCLHEIALSQTKSTFHVTGCAFLYSSANLSIYQKSKRQLIIVHSRSDFLCKGSRGITKNSQQQQQQQQQSNCNCFGLNIAGVNEESEERGRFFHFQEKKKHDSNNNTTQQQTIADSIPIKFKTTRRNNNRHNSNNNNSNNNKLQQGKSGGQEEEEEDDDVMSSTNFSASHMSASNQGTSHAVAVSDFDGNFFVFSADSGLATHQGKIPNSLRKEGEKEQEEYNELKDAVWSFEYLYGKKKISRRTIIRLAFAGRGTLLVCSTFDTLYVFKLEQQLEDQKNKNKIQISTPICHLPVVPKQAFIPHSQNGFWMVSDLSVAPTDHFVAVTLSSPSSSGKNEERASKSKLLLFRLPLLYERHKIVLKLRFLPNTAFKAFEIYWISVLVCTYL